MANKAAKGSAFERWFCGQLSLWWSGGKDTDIFWRTAGSGGRATNRGRKGKQTAGAYGDIAATDHRGQPVLSLMAIEVKRGYQKDTIQDALDKPAHAARQTYEDWILQAEQSAKLAGSVGWAVVFRRNRRVAMIMLPQFLWSFLRRAVMGDVTPIPFMTAWLPVQGNLRIVVMMPLQAFLEAVQPFHVHRVLGDVE